LPILLSQNFGIAEGLQLGLLPAGDLPIGRDVWGDYATLIREIGAAGTMLLKNVNGTLLLSSPRWIGVFGNDATDFSDGLTGRAIEALSSGQGTLSIGGGGGAGCHTYIVPPLEAIKAKARSTGAIIQYITNNALLEAANEINSIYPIPEVCIVFLKSFTGEGSDRTSLKADGNLTAIIENVAALCPNTVVVTHSVGTLVMPWAKDPNVKAILAANLPGQESGNSIVDVLWGDVNPSGKLPYTIPVNETDYPPPITNITGPVSNSSAWQADFTEGQLIDYRHFDAKNITPLYEFGFGLSYTTFDIPSPSPLVITRLAPNISVRPDAACPTEPRGNPDLWLDLVSVETKVSNTGSVAGHSVPQLYLSLPSTTPGGTPVRILRGFERIYLQPGEAKSVKFMLQRRDLSFWDTEVNIWVIPSGLFSFQVGFSSRDLRSKGSLAVLS
jgi:beta-glucosidase